MSSVQHTLTVELGSRSYPIYIGSGLLQQAELLRQHITGKQVMVVTNSTIAPLYLQGILKATYRWTASCCKMVNSISILIQWG